jgi:aldehyde:ferredoxin oxidoreductase
LTLSPQQFQQFAEKVINLERILSIKLHGRTRSDDEMLIPYFEQSENSVNPLIGEPISLDKQKFLNLLDEYYTLRGWDISTGHPTPEKLQALGLDHTAVHESF